MTQILFLNENINIDYENYVSRIKLCSNLIIVHPKNSFNSYSNKEKYYL
jgi:hypothetical protein